VECLGWNYRPNFIRIFEKFQVLKEKLQICVLNFTLGRLHTEGRINICCYESCYKWTPDRGCHVVSVTDPYGRILGFLDRSNYETKEKKSDEFITN
jgi:hypothetical protein